MPSGHGSSPKPGPDAPSRSAPLYLALATLLFALFVGNVAAGSLRGAPVVGDVGEMLLLFGASIAFVAAVGRAERRRNERAAAAPRPPPPTGEPHDPS